MARDISINRRNPGALAGRSAMLCAVCCILALIGTTSLAADDTDGRFLAGLRERRLFDLAEAYSTRQLARDDLSAARRAGAVIELMRTHAEHALQSPPHARDVLWEKAHAVAADFKAAAADHPRLLLVDLQDALTWLARGELARQEAEVVAQGQARRDEARGQLRSAVRQLENLGEQVSVELRRSRRARSVAIGELTVVELESLKRNIAYQLARALRGQGQCYDADSPDRINSIAQSLERLAPLASAAPADSLAWKSRIDEVVCFRLLNDRRRGTERLAALVAGGPPPAIALRAQAEKIRLQLAAGHLDAALAEVNKGRTRAGQSSSDLDYAHLETYVALWQTAARAGRQPTTTELLARATGQVQLIEREHGPYWMRRAKMLLASSITGAGGGSSLAALRIAAEEAYLGGQRAEALATYDQAFDQALAEQDDSQAFELGFAAATIEHDAERRRQALDRYRSLALRLTTHPRAGEAHLLAIFNAAELARAGSPQDQTDAFTEYASLIDEHLEHWPQSSTADQARWWLANLRRSEGRWEDAVAAYRAIRSSDAQYGAAVQASAACYAAWLEELVAQGQPTRELARQAADYFEQLTVESVSRAAQRSSDTARFSAVAAARLRLRYGDRDFAPAERVLTAALGTDDDAADEVPGAWRAEARVLLVYALAGQGKWHAARDALEQASSASARRLVVMIERLVELGDTADTVGRRNVAEIVFRAVMLIESSAVALNETDARSVALSRAWALVAAGRSAQALKAYDALVEALPGDGDVQEARASLLTTEGDARALESALVAWRGVEKKSALAGERWFRARLAQADVYHRLGQDDRAAKLIKLTRALHPDLGGRATRSKFLALLAQCE